MENPYENNKGTPIKGQEIKWLNWERENSVNPYSNKDGSPENGKELQFFEWEAKENKKRLDILPESIKSKTIKDNNHLQDKMES